jgi:hypothetical protein
MRYKVYLELEEMNRMNANQIYTALESLDQGKSQAVDSQTAQFMQERGLIAILDSTQYRRMQSDASRLDSVKRDVASYQSQVGDYQTQTDTLNGKLNSGWHKFWSRQTTLDGEKRSLDDAQSKLSKANQGLTDSQAEKERVEGVKQNIEGYVRTSDGYVKPTDKGSKRFNSLGVRLYRTAEKQYDDVATEIDATAEKVSEKAKRFADHYDPIKQKFYADRNTIQAASILSRNEQTPETNLENLFEAYDNLNEQGWYGEDLPVIANTLSITGDQAETVNILKQTYGRLKQEIYSSRGIKVVAQQLATRKSDKPIDQRVDEYLSLNNQVKELTWSSDSTHIATAILSGSENQSLAFDRFKEIYQQTKEKLWSSDEIVLASAIMASTNQGVSEIFGKFSTAYDNGKEAFWSDDQLALAMSVYVAGSRDFDDGTRFIDAYNGLKTRFWSDDELFAVASKLTRLPFSIDEVLDTFDTVYPVVKGTIGWQDNTTIATAADIATKSFDRDFFLQYLTDTDAHDFSSSDYSSLDTSSGFNLGWAVAGDLIDNGSLDLSGGFIAGGLIGGLFD